MAELVAAVSQIIVAMVSLVGIGGGGIYVMHRRRNGQSAIPGSPDTDMLRELRSIHTTLRANGDKNSEEHERLMDTLAPRRPVGMRD